MNTKSQNRLPNLLIIGVPKAGTTSLYKYLSESDDVFFPQVKEPHFFAENQVCGRIPVCVRTWQDYVQLFQSAGGRKIRGEASVFYFLYTAEVIEKIKKYLGDDLRIILVLRNPIFRAFSAYKYALAMNKHENQTFRQALEMEEKRKATGATSPMLYYLTCGLYSERLVSWRSAFDEMKVIIFDDLILNPAGIMAELYEYLNIDPPAGRSYTARHNPSFGDTWKNPKLGGLVKKVASRHVRDIGHRFFPSGYARMKQLFLEKAMKTTSLTSYDKDLMREFYREDVVKTSKLLGRDLSFWLDS